MKSKITQKHYLLVLLFAAIAGMIFLYPHGYLTYKYGFANYEKTLQGDEEPYSGRVVNPYNDPHIWENRNNPTPWEMWPVKIFSLFERGIGIENTLILWDFLAPFLYVVAFFVMIMFSLNGDIELTKGESMVVIIGLLSSCFFFGGLNSFNIISAEFIDYIYRHDPIILGNRWYKIHLISGITRIFHPALNFPLFLLFIGWFVKCLRSYKSHSIYLLMSGALLGVSLYIRIYDYIVIGCILGLLFFIYLVCSPLIVRVIQRLQMPKIRLILLLIAGYLLFGPVYIGIFYRITPDFLKVIGYLIAGCIVLLLFVLHYQSYYYQENRNVRNIVIVAVGYLLTSLPRLISLMFYRINNPEFLEHSIIASGQNFLQRHAPNMYSIRYGFYLLILFSVSKKIIDNTQKVKRFAAISQVPLLICAGTIIGWNLQVFAGQNLDPQHYREQYISPMLVFIIIFSVLYLFYMKFGSKYVIIIPLFLCLVAGLSLQVAFVREIGIGYRAYIKYEKDDVQNNVYQWIAHHTERNSVIASNYYPSTVTMYTKRFTFVPYLTYSPSTTLDEFCERYLLMQGMLGYDLAAFFEKNEDPPIKAYRRQHLIDTSLKGYIFWPLTFRSLSSIQESLNKFASFKGQSQEWFLGYALSKYKLDYLIITPFDVERVPQTLPFFEHNPSFKKVFSYGEASVYKIVHSGEEL